MGRTIPSFRIASLEEPPTDIIDTLEYILKSDTDLYIYIVKINSTISTLVEEDYSKKLKSFESLKFDNDLLARLDTDTHSFWFEGNNHLLKNDVSIDEKLLNNFLRGIISWCTQEPVNKWNEDGISHYRMQEYDDARKDFNKVIEVYPEFSAVWFNIGLSFNEERQYQEAIKYYDKALEIDPRYAVIWFKT